MAHDRSSESDERDEIGREPQRYQMREDELVQRRQQILVDQREVATAILVVDQVATALIADDLTHGAV